MNLEFLKLPEEERRLYMEQTALRRNISPVVLEKDFWVCWILAVLFESEFSPCLVFKGGTSLSKVFGVIQRFSEDIDLSVSPDFLGLPDAGASRNQANKWMTNAEAACGELVQKQIQSVLEAHVQRTLGRPVAFGRKRRYYTLSTIAQKTNPPLTDFRGTTLILHRWPNIQWFRPPLLRTFFAIRL